MKEFVESVTNHLPVEDYPSVLTLAVVQVLTDATCRKLFALNVPEQCPAFCDDGSLCVIRRTHKEYPSVFVINAEGCFRLLAERYVCRTHARTWVLPATESSAGCSLVGDLVGRYLIQPNWWPDAIQTFLETESLVAIERRLRQRTASSVGNQVTQHALMATLSELEVTLLHQSLMAHCQASPVYSTIKKWLCAWTRLMVAPAVGFLRTL